MKLDICTRYEIKVTEMSRYELLALQRACESYSRDCQGTNDNAATMKKIADSIQNRL